MTDVDRRQQAKQYVPPRASNKHYKTQLQLYALMTKTDQKKITYSNDPYHFHLHHHFHFFEGNKK